MIAAHALPAPIKGATHVDITEIVIAAKRGVIIVRGQLGEIGQVPGPPDPVTGEPGLPVDGFIPDADLTERVVTLAGEHYEGVFARGLARGLPARDFGRQDLLAEVDQARW